jgi:hypothetical protein
MSFLFENRSEHHNTVLRTQKHILCHKPKQLIGRQSNLRTSRHYTFLRFVFFLIDDNNFIMCFCVLSPVLWCSLRFSNKNDMKRCSTWGHPSVFSGVRFTPSLVFFLVFDRSLFVRLSFFVLPLYCSSSLYDFCCIVLRRLRLLLQCSSSLYDFCCIVLRR